MAKKFAGFKQEAMEKKILPALGYTGPMDQKSINAFLASNPGAAAKMGRYTLAARQRIEGNRMGMAEGGLTSAVDAAQATVTDRRNALSAAQLAAAANPQDTSLMSAVNAAQVALTQSEAALSSARSNLTGSVNTPEVRARSIADPMSITQTAPVATATPAQVAAGTIDPTAGQMTAPLATATPSAVTPAAPAMAAAPQPAATVTAQTAADPIAEAVEDLTAATGAPSEAAQAQAATMQPTDLAQLAVAPETIAQARTVEAPAPRAVQEGEMIAGPTVDMERVRTETNFAAATGAPSTDATVQGQLTGLMEQFEGNEPPAWAAGAMRAATATMAARGLGASSMAGQAIIQAAMESALPIAVQDAQTAASFEMQNLSNRQQAALFAAEKRAEFLNLEFTQDFQTRVTNAAKISDIANINFSADVQVALENAQMAQTVDLENLSAKNAKIMADVAAMSQVDMTNLNNRQQAQVQTANAFLSMDMRNLDNEQQTSMFKTQEMVNAMLSDQAAANAALQFNATSENQTNQFFSSLATQVSQFNSEQSNAIARFNAGEANSLAQFNATQNNARDQFNAQNHLVVAQANAEWINKITTAQNAAENQANRDAVLAANNFTMTGYNNMLQRERDILSWAWSSGESALERDSNVVVAKIAADAKAGDATDPLASASGKVLSAIADNAIDLIFGKD